MFRETPIKREKKSKIILPQGAYYYKTKNGKWIYKNRWVEEYYIVIPATDGYIIETYIGKCRC